LTYIKHEASAINKSHKQQPSDKSGNLKLQNYRVYSVVQTIEVFHA